ncbi:MAG: SGNH/GDSL hydrolase family protein [Planctomycetota bacterium]|jgi:acyl-CoA thioesterase-1
MNWLVYHIASGHAFFTGVVLVIIAALTSTRSKPIAKRITVSAFLIGAIAITISSTAIPYWYYVIALVLTLAWAISRYVKKWRRWAPFAVIAAWAVAAAIEVPYHITPTLNATSSRSITIIGDSVTAGMGGNDKSERWPHILARQHNLTVQDISHMGETAASALKRVKRQQIASPVVVLEIGGNDLLGSTSSAQFSRDLDALLGHVASPGRQIVMFELPLPPFNHEYGRIQRSLARKHNVSLVPKRVFLSILAANDSTLDTIHLSQAGHERMAACVWQLVSSAFPARTAAQPADQPER